MAKKKPGKGKIPGKKSPKTPVPYDQMSPEDQQKANDNALKKFYGQQGNSAGNALINKFLQPGSLGRVDTNLAGATENLGRYKELQDRYSTRDATQTDVMNRMQGGLEGYTAPQYQAQREQMQRGLDSNLNTSVSQLAKAQARGKVYGAAGVAQQQNLIRGNEDTKNNMAQDLYVKNIDEQQRRLGEYGAYGRGLNTEEHQRQLTNTQAYGDEESRLRQEELDRQKINLGQGNAETSAQIGAYLGAVGTGLEQENFKSSQRIQQQGINAITGGGRKKTKQAKTELQD